MGREGGSSEGGREGRSSEGGKGEREGEREGLERVVGNGGGE